MRLEESEPLSSDEENTSTHTTLEHVIEACGSFHLYQYIHFFFLSLFPIASGIVSFYYVFGVAENPYQCQASNYKNRFFRTEVLPSQCSYLVQDDRNETVRIEPCTSWNYDQRTFGHTFTSEANFVCERSIYRSFLATMLQLGAMLIFFIGQITDKIGRRRSLQLVTGLYLVTSITTQSLIQFVPMSINQKFGLLLINQFVAGIDTFLVSFVLLMELTTSKHATFVGNIGLISYTIGEIILTGMAYLCRHWLRLKWVITLYFLALVPYLLCMPESPQWLLTKHRYNELETLLRQIARRNQRSESKWLPVYRSMIRSHQKESALNRNNKVKLSVTAKARRFFTHAPTMSRLFISGLLGFVTLLLYFKISFNLGAMDAMDPYLSMIIGAFIETLGYIAPGLLMIRFNRKPVFILFLIPTAIYLFVTPFTLGHSPWIVVLTAQFGKFAISAANGVAYIFVPELFPTSIRGTGMGFFILSSRVGSTLAPMIDAQIRHNQTLVTNMYYGYASSIIEPSIALVLLLARTSLTLVITTYTIIKFDVMNEKKRLLVDFDMNKEYNTARTASSFVRADEQSFLPINPFAEPATTMSSAHLTHHPTDDDMIDIDFRNSASEKLNNGVMNVDLVNTHYDDFQTIDWLKDLMRDRLRHRLLRAKTHNSLLNKILMYHDAWSGWLCVLLVGLSAGVIAAVIDIGTNWISHLKHGICLNAFWLNREQCCWASRDLQYTNVNTEDCGEWFTWPQVFGASKSGFGQYLLAYIMYIFWSTIFATFAVLLVKVFAPYACGSGIPEIKTILGGFVIRGYLGKWTLLIKSIGMMCATSAGLILGKEGPFVHIACCCGNIFSYLFPKYGRNEAKKREILSAAAAAGVSVAFGAPIGGVLFSLEEVSYYFPYKTLWRSFFCAMVGALVVRSINPYGNGHDIQFSIDYSVPWASFELLPFILLGILGGLWGAFFIKTNIWWCRFRKNSRLGQYTILEVVGLALITAFIIYPNPYTRMSMSELIKRLVSQCRVEDMIDLCDYPNSQFTNGKSKGSVGLAGPGVHQAIWQLFFALIVQVALVTFTMGIKVPSGLIIPSMSIGAITGRIIGIITEQLAVQNPTSLLFRHDCSKEENCVTPALYAIVGACAFLGGVSKMTISLVVIMFELTGGLTYIVPLMAAAMTAKWIGDGFVRGGIYDAYIELNGYPFLDNKEEFNFTTTAAEVMRPRPEQRASLTFLTQNGMTFTDVEQLLKDTTHTFYPVVVSHEQPYVVGQVQRRDLQIVLKSQKMHRYRLSSTVIQFTSSTEAAVNSDYDSDGQPEQRLTTNSEVIRVANLLDQAPIIVTDQTPMETVIDLFRKLGLRQAFVTRNGRLRGIITKKDILRHIQQMSSHNVETAYYDN